ncbi:MAG: hypothetical protein CME70_05045 [Halobacteriovorax sp.]|nr:hypothetical protein [Halobacteriovorax sp.]|tara:strand:+ start:45770 stop:46636 length:867 start_codon:yes stop_codon:yes gene_type:complete
MLVKFVYTLVFILLWINKGYSKNIFIHSSISLSTSTSLWLKGDEKTDYQQPGFDKAIRTYYQGALNTTLSLDADWDLYFGFRYGHVRMNDGPFLGATQRTKRSQLSEVSGGVGYTFYKDRDTKVAVFGKYIYPGGDTKRRKPAFLSFNDFGSHAELGLYSSHFFESWEYHPLLKYKHKTSGLGNHHLAMENKLFFNFTKRFKLGPGVDLFTTSGGRDILDDAFNAYVSETGWFPVWNKKEKWLGVSAIGAYQFKNQLIFDFYIHRKVIGENTDISTTVAFGIGKGFNL